MNQTGTSMKQQKSEAAAHRVDMKLEVDIIPVSDDPNSSSDAWVGGSTTTSPRPVAFESSS